MAQPLDVTPSFSLRYQKGFEASGMQASSSPTLIIELNASEKTSSSESYSLLVHARAESAVGKETDNGISSAAFDSSHGTVTEADLSDLGIIQAMSKLETLPTGGHEVDAYGQGVQLYYSRPPSHEWWNGPAPGCSIAAESAHAASAPSDENREVFASIVKTVEKLRSKATKGSGAGTMGSKGAEPDTAFED